MYGIYANIWGILMVNVTIYSIHGSYGLYPYRFPLLAQMGLFHPTDSMDRVDDLIWAGLFRHHQGSKGSRRWHYGEMWPHHIHWSDSTARMVTDGVGWHCRGTEPIHPKNRKKEYWSGRKFRALVITRVTCWTQCPFCILYVFQRPSAGWINRGMIACPWPARMARMARRMGCGDAGIWRRQSGVGWFVWTWEFTVPLSN